MREWAEAFIVNTDLPTSREPREVGHPADLVIQMNPTHFSTLSSISAKGGIHNQHHVASFRTPPFHQRGEESGVLHNDTPLR